MEFNKLYKKIADLDKPREILNETYKPVEECGIMGSAMGAPLGGMMDDKPTTMSVNMNASGAEGIRELLNILQGKGDDGMDGPDGSPAGVLVGMDGPDGGDDMHGDDAGPDGGEMSPLSKSPSDDSLDPNEGNAFGMQARYTDKGDKFKVGDQEYIKSEEYANQPNPSMGNTADMTPTGDDLSSKGGNEIQKPAGGGNPYSQKSPMAEALKNKLQNLYKELKTR